MVAAVQGPRKLRRIRALRFWERGNKHLKRIGPKTGRWAVREKIVNGAPVKLDYSGRPPRCSKCRGAKKNPQADEGRTLEERSGDAWKGPSGGISMATLRGKGRLPAAMREKPKMLRKARLSVKTDDVSVHTQGGEIWAGCRPEGFRNRHTHKLV